MQDDATDAGPAASLDEPAPVWRSANAACAAVLAVEVIGSISMWAPIPLAWMWVGARVYYATGSIAADLGVILLGFVASMILTMKALVRLDTVWVALRRRAGHQQAQGALTQIVVVSATLGLLAFFLWYYVLSNGAFVIRFMPSQ